MGLPLTCRRPARASIPDLPRGRMVALDHRVASRGFRAWSARLVPGGAEDQRCAEPDAEGAERHGQHLRPQEDDGAAEPRGRSRPAPSAGAPPPRGRGAGTRRRQSRCRCAARPPRRGPRCRPLPPAPGRARPRAARTRRRCSSTISVELAEVLEVHRLHRAAEASSSTTTSSSQLPIQLARLRFVEPTRAQRASATAVLAWSIGPFHSKTRTPASSSGR